MNSHGHFYLPRLFHNVLKINKDLNVEFIFLSYLLTSQDLVPN